MPKDCQPQLATRRSRRSSAWGDTAAGERLRHPASSNLKLQGQRQGLKPRHIQHDIQDAKGDGKGSSARLAQPRSLTGARRRNFIREMRDLTYGEQRFAVSKVEQSIMVDQESV